MGIYFKLVKRSFLFLLGGVISPLFSTSIQIINDSSFALNAQVLDRTGRLLDIIHLVAGQMYIYDVSQSSFEPNTDSTYTPYTVIFLCESGRPYDYSLPKKQDQKNANQKKQAPPEYISQFGIWTNVPRGATVTALTSPEGTKSCTMKKQKKLNKRKNSGNSTNEGSGNWSNDGGQTWSNDSGSSSGSCSNGDGSCLQIQGRRERSKRATNNNQENPFLNDGGSSYGNDGGNPFSNDGGDAVQTDPSTSFSNDGGSSYTNDGGNPFSNDGGDATQTNPANDFTNDGGSSYNNDGGNMFSNDTTNPPPGKTKNAQPTSKWSNDQNEESHIPTKKTPLPFQSRS